MVSVQWVTTPAPAWVVTTDPPMATDPTLSLNDWRYYQGPSPLTPATGSLIAGAYHFRDARFDGSEVAYDYSGSFPALYSVTGTRLEPIAKTAIPIA